MEKQKRTWLKTISSMLLTGLLLGVVLGLGGIFLMFMPMYVQQGVMAVMMALWAALVVSSGKILHKRWLGRMWLGVLIVCLAAGGWIWKGEVDAAVPTLNEGSLLYDYQPFRPDTKAVLLEEEASFRMPEDQLLRLDGATALYPVYAAFAQAVYPEREYLYFDSPVACSTTTEAYENLIAGRVDMIFAGGPSDAQQAAAEQAGLTLHLTPLGREAFVFFVNSRNPVENLTVQDIQGIYTGEITSWKQLGGRNQRIRPFQRDEGSGSQTALQSLMRGLPLMAPEKEDIVDGMGGILTRVADYRNFDNAIGYSFRFYTTEMAANDEIKLLAINGVKPTAETIRDGSYPLASYFYVVTAAPIGQPEERLQDPVMDAFLQWMTSEQGQAIVEKTGYVPLE